jgi:hypothetical protein
MRIAFRLLVMAGMLTFTAPAFATGALHTPYGQVLSAQPIHTVVCGVKANGAVARPATCSR